MIQSKYENHFRRLWPLHWLLWVCAAVGVAALLIARGHYTVDVVIAYFVTTRLWFLHNLIINHRQLHQRASTNFLARLWWWRLAVWFEENVRGPVPPGARKHNVN